ncbi:MAG: class I tRNA ligase family protein [Mycoplasmataceae bacterium]|nr:class I tRNA ligase family protein [Mycoplasmataceae bacterium]
MNFDHQKIEKKWQAFWKNNNVFKVNLDTKLKKFYALDMFPYPSGSGLHVGHPEGYTATDIISRMKKMQGFEVLHPMGWDAFGLPAEQYAILTGNNPAEFTQININNFKKQLNSLGFTFDWDKEINTTDPNYFKTTQWIFAQLYRHNLVELKNIEVNWSPSLNTVLSNEEVIENKLGQQVSERDGLPIEKKVMKQWVLKITKYAKRLFDGLDHLDWPESVKKLQKNWIYYRDDNKNYTKSLHLRDWVFARQRYWGEPFPLIHFDNGEIYLIPESNYPIELPIINNYTFSQDGKPALANATDWIHVEIDGKKGIRDLNTMPQWAGSSWYYIGYLLREKDSFLPIDSKEAKKRLNHWLPVDLYVGGTEHAVLHLLYARFWHMFLHDIGITKVKEPFKKLANQGMILGKGNVKMSKSKGNVVSPDLIVKNFGADSLRLYEMFMGAFEDDKSWTDKGIKSSNDWLNRVYRIFLNLEIKSPSNEMKNYYNDLIISVTNNYEALKFNLAISDQMVFINHLYKEPQLTIEMARGFLKLFSCICPHLGDELNSILLKNDQETLYHSSWPQILKVTKINKSQPIIIQINGKIRKKLPTEVLPQNPTTNQLKTFVLIHCSKWIKNETEIKKIILIKDYLISVVI